MMSHIANLLISAKCKRYFTRVVELHDPDAPHDHPNRPRHSILPSERKRRENDLNSTRACDICHPSKPHSTQAISKRKCCLSDTDSDDGDVQGFIRVRLISRRRRATIKIPKLKIPDQVDPLGYFIPERESSRGFGVHTTLDERFSKERPLVSIKDARRNGVNYRRTNAFSNDSEDEDGTDFPLVLPFPPKRRPFGVSRFLPLETASTNCERLVESNLRAGYKLAKWHA